VPPEVAKLFEERRQAIVSGKLLPFSGPLKDNSGAVKVPAGTAMTDQQLMAIDWYVEGVEGAVPK
jgi:simple sugar transport system substrate-binding protein